MLISAYTVPLILVTAVCVYIIIQYNLLSARLIRAENSRNLLETQCTRLFVLVESLIDAAPEMYPAETDIPAVPAAVEQINGVYERYMEAADSDALIEAGMQAAAYLQLIAAGFDAAAAENPLLDELQQIGANINRIGSFYNGKAVLYNNALRKFPGILLAALFQLKPLQCFEAAHF